MSRPGRGPDRAEVERWVRDYRRAWESNDVADIAALFTEDARYFPEPFREPSVGRDRIVAWWLEHRDEPGDTSFRFEVLAVCDDVAFVQGTTEYHTAPPRTYSNLWVVRFEDGRCSEFTEWWAKHR